MRSGEASLQTGPFGTQLSASEYVEHGIPVINVRNVGFGEIRTDDLEFVTEAKAEQLHHHRLQADDIVFGRKGAVERHGLATSSHDGWVQGSDCLRLRLRTNRVLVRFLSYYLRTKGHGDWMHALCSFGATMASLNQDIVSRIAFPLPSVETQRKVAAILSAYDDLIANNQRRIALLEGMAEEIYREWFVRMRFPGTNSAVMRKVVPVGWSRKKLDELLAERKRPLKTADLKTVERYVGLEHIPRKTVVLNAWGQPDSVESDKLQFAAGDILFGKIRPYLHKVAIAPFSGACSTDTIVLTSRRPDTALFAYFTVFSDTFIELATAASNGTKMPRANWHFLRNVEVTVPSHALLNSFNSLAMPMIDHAASLLALNQTLCRARDALLPRLISGKLKVDHLDIRLPPSMRAEAEATA